MSDPTANVPPSEPTPPPASAAPTYQAQPAPVYAQQKQSFAYGAPAGPGPETFNVLAIVSFVSAFVVSLAAVICGHIALSQIKKTGEKGRGLAIAGLVIGYAGILVGLTGAIVAFVSLFVLVQADPNMLSGQ
ncbi:DUF4190 domain-containing protein [Cryobacterium psychrophilum]|uniref:DUF4190 domain-containing protein n=1 Tax=Cryobacterium psychrophilum TaxID=41988 RepID=A0A4Y8KXM7_9MICO|nr:DUF4190 domain-containing protein [Cryobacterium psychrophilum]TDW29650.1 uncharacterized protein DUF4190 [Cryobacterium psychrophilum]TFD81766.1 DUF4190 domain-containing protein [Cryobacterium psychrophilum]